MLILTIRADRVEAYHLGSVHEVGSVNDEVIGVNECRFVSRDRVFIIYVSKFPVCYRSQSCIGQSSPCDEHRTLMSWNNTLFHLLKGQRLLRTGNSIRKSTNTVYRAF